MFDTINPIFAQTHLPEIDLNDPETLRFLKKVSDLASKERKKDHNELMAWYRKKMAEICSSVEQLQDECFERERKTVYELLDEVAFYKAAALYIQVQLDVARQIAKKEEMVKHLRVVK